MSSLPTLTALRNRFLQEDLNWRYTEFYFWGAIMMRAITAAFDDDLFLPGPVIAHGGSVHGHYPAGLIYSRRAHHRGKKYCRIYGPYADSDQ